ncbi:hypothetical protein ES754_10780 [Psychrobacter frigidicola]|uniref:DUF4864 domain-containing protein n=1 Tax=Psychrobacter frigidicola TaxID=45611 RepID=A0A5C7A2F7_9GAMM|nr:hypothetical protein ES754_10780 [Psychrobacter frigidicola]
MVSTLLSLSFISISAHAATSNLTSVISRAEAANPTNFKRLNVNGRAATYASAPCSVKKGLIICGLEKLKLINSSINEVNADYDLAQTFFFPSKAQPRTAVVVITRSGLMDDSVSAERYRISFKLEGKPSDLNWHWVQYGVQYQCARGSKAGKWTKNICP